jgi:hypothetical protein
MASGILIRAEPLHLEVHDAMTSLTAAVGAWLGAETVDRAGRRLERLITSGQVRSASLEAVR